MINQQFLEDIAAILEASPKDLDNNFPFTRDNWNSLSIVSAIVLIDEHFGLTIPGEKLRECQSFGDLINLISSNNKK